MSRFTIFALGAVAATVGREPLRKAAKKVIRAGMNLRQEVDGLVAETIEDRADAAAAAKAGSTTSLN